jgi:hypothetical protein
MACRIDLGLALANCTDFSVGGLTGKFWLINRADWLAAAITEGGDNEITAIVPVTPESGEAFAYAYEVPPASIVTGHALTKNTGISGYTHLFTFLNSDGSMAMKNSMQALLNTGKAVLIFATQAPKIAVPAESKSPPYLLLGKNYGLELSSSEGNHADQASGGASIITLSTPTVGGGLELNTFTNVQMTTAAIEALEAVTA